MKKFDLDYKLETEIYTTEEGINYLQIKQCLPVVRAKDVELDDEGNVKLNWTASRWVRESQALNELIFEFNNIQENAATDNDFSYAPNFEDFEAGVDRMIDEVMEYVFWNDDASSVVFDIIQSYQKKEEIDATI